MFVPLLPVQLTGRLGIALTQTGIIYLLFLLGMIVISPFMHYLVDVYKRKYLCFWSYLTILLMISIYPVLSNSFEMYLVPFIQGIAFGIASSTFITLSIDVLSSENRSRGNIRFRWFARLGMVLGIAAGSLIFTNYGFHPVILVSNIVGLLGALLLLLIRIPFRAPIGVKLFTLDRFFLPQGWFLFLNMLMVSVSVGLLLPLIYSKVTDILLLKNWDIPYFTIVAVGYLLTLFAAKYLFQKHNKWRKTLAGMLAMLISFCLLILFDFPLVLCLSGLLLGAGLGFIGPVFMWMFIGMADHCERATANYTYQLSWETGLAAGIALSCYFNAHFSTIVAYRVAMFCLALALIYFILVSAPLYKRNKVR